MSRITQTEDRMKYEYRQLEISARDMVGELNALGSEGFNVVGMDFSKGPPAPNGAEGETEIVYVILSRPLEDESA